MSGRIAATVDGTLVSEADRARIEAEEALHGAWQRRTVRVVAGAARDAADCRLLLDILGLDDQIIASARTEMSPAKESDAGREDAA